MKTVDLEPHEWASNQNRFARLIAKFAPTIAKYSAWTIMLTILYIYREGWPF